MYRKHSGGLEELNVEQEAAESDTEDLTGDVLHMDLGDTENSDKGQDLDESTQIQHGSKLNETAARFLLALKVSADTICSELYRSHSWWNDKVEVWAIASVSRGHTTADGGCSPDMGCSFVADSPFKGLETEYLQMKYYKEYFNLVVSVPHLKLA